MYNGGFCNRTLRNILYICMCVYYLRNTVTRKEERTVKGVKRNCVKVEEKSSRMKQTDIEWLRTSTEFLQGGH